MQETARTAKRWRFATRTDWATDADVRRLAQQLKVDPLLAMLLQQRNITDPGAATQFMRPRMTDLHDPTLLPGIDQAAKRILTAVRDQQPIVIYGDYDVDGITASAILFHLLTAIGASASTYVPHRIDEGYGLNADALRQIASTDPIPLIISVDCGITAVEPAAAARDAGADLIITDHHEFDAAALPDAAALVHPRLPGSTYPFDHLCGAGVAFKLAWHIARLHCGSDRVSDELRGLLVDLMSLAALGTIADVVPLVDENRAITACGLGAIKKTRFAGLNALIDASRLRDEKISAYHVGFVLGPRLNACGRMGHARDAVQLLTDAEGPEAARIAGFLTQENDRRRQTERDIFDEAKQMVIDRGYDSPDQRAIVLASEGWHAGVVGIVASRLVEAFCRPVVMLSITDGEAHGSARSVDEVSIHDALSNCASHLNTFGGHAMAAGMRLDADKVDGFRAALIEQVNAVLGEDALTPVVHIDAACEITDVSLELTQQIDRLSPFGRENPTPVLAIQRVRLARPAHRVGSGGTHLKFTVTDGKTYLDAIAFGFGDMATELAMGVDIDVAFEPKINEWQGRRTAQMVVKDVRVSQ